MMKEKIMKLSEFRKRNHTQKEMADILKISERQYRRIEKDVCKPDIWTAIKIADALGVENLRELWNYNKPN